MKTTLSLAAGMLLTGATTHADVLFSNFGVNDTYNPNIGETLSFGGPLGGDAYEHAVPFIVRGGDHFFDSAEVAIFHFWGPDLVHAALHADAGGVPGAILEAATGSGVSTPGVVEPPMVLAFSGNTVLRDQMMYWLSIRTEPTDAHLAWAHNIVDDFDLRAWRVNGGPWNPAYGMPGTDTQRAVYRVNGTPVPGPGAAGVVLAGLLVARRRR
jgi:hypothetical protein